MEHGSIIARICYEKILPSGDKQHVTIGKLIYYRSHSEDTKPSCQFRWDVVPSVAWAHNPDVYFIGNFEPSEKIPEAPFIDGDVFVTSDTKGDHVKIGHIHIREREKDGACQYYMQLNGVPIGEVIRQQKRAFIRCVEMTLASEKAMEEPNELKTVLENLSKMIDAKRKSIYCTVQID